MSEVEALIIVVFRRFLMLFLLAHLRFYRFPRSLFSKVLHIFGKNP